MTDQNTRPTPSSDVATFDAKDADCVNEVAATYHNLGEDAASWRTQKSSYRGTVRKHVRVMSDAFKACGWHIVRKSALSASPAQVVVKPLEWVDRSDREEGYCYYGFGAFGHTFTVKIEKTGYWGAYTAQGGKSQLIGWFDTKTEAKAAAQDDYERRIRSTLIDTPAQVEVTDEEREIDRLRRERDYAWERMQNADAYLRAETNHAEQAEARAEAAEAELTALRAALTATDAKPVRCPQCELGIGGHEPGCSNAKPVAHEHIEVTDAGLLGFAEWFRKNYPGPDTIIHKPDWHSPKIYRAALHHARSTDAKPVVPAEPVAFQFWLKDQQCWTNMPTDWKPEEDAEGRYTIRPLYAAPPSPVEGEVERALRRDWHGVYLDGRNEHGSHVIRLPQRSIELEQDDNGDFLKEHAETILNEAETLGFSIGDAVVLKFTSCTDEGFFSHYELDGIDRELTALLYGSADEQAGSRAHLASEGKTDA